METAQDELNAAQQAYNDAMREKMTSSNKSKMANLQRTVKN